MPSHFIIVVSDNKDEGHKLKANEIFRLLAMEKVWYFRDKGIGVNKISQGDRFIFYLAGIKGRLFAGSAIAASGVHIKGIGIASLVNIFNPDVVTLSGGLVGCFHHMEDAMRRSFRETAIAISRDHVRILTGTPGEDGGMLGAAILASENAGKG